MPFCILEDVSIYYEEKGEGPPLLFISGLGGGSWSWRPQIEYFASRYRTITFDNRGAGRSDAPEGPYSMEMMAQDALGLLDRLEIDKAFVFGLSMGGMIALALALRAPERIRALALGCTFCGWEQSVRADAETLELFLNNVGLSHEAILRKNVPILFGETCRLNRQDVIDAYCQSRLSAVPQSEHGLQAQVAAIEQFESCDRLPRIRIPTLIFSGADDKLIPVQNSRVLAERIPEARLIEIPGAGHAIHAECADLINPLADDFFSRCLPRTATL